MANPPTVDRELRSSFDDVALLYDEVRPGYPERMVEDILALADMPNNGRILEVGCGTGQATLPFARRGYLMLCLDLGPALAALAAHRCRGYRNVEVQNISFEEWPLQAQAFDLVLSAEAFHWIPPELGYPKAAAALKDAGSLALCWHHSSRENTPFRWRVEEVYRALAPHLLKHLPGQQSSDAHISATLQDFNASGLFGPVVVRQYPWSETLSAKRYLALLNTYSPIRSLPEEIRQELLSGIGEVIAQFGGRVESTGMVVLYMARVQR